MLSGERVSALGSAQIAQLNLESKDVRLLEREHTSLSVPPPPAPPLPVHSGRPTGVGPELLPDEEAQLRAPRLFLTPSFDQAQSLPD